MTNALTPAAFALLLALTEGDRHGYGLIADVEHLTGGHLVLGPGTLYRTLQRLRVEGLVEEVEIDEQAVRADRRAERRRSYRITPTGLAAVRQEARRLATLVDSDTARKLLRADRKDN
ncbi:PadR family transcriptional regulator [Longimycelium tulufanense]|uniref:PadR family transcriptional regulator n=1 Tax=Longimycelium tulufanense TaxID=907463 RepID=A0A8J3C8G4_9PSEU|nr:helix-turn-helix transcriptional regulator [Longimycelium tulufanense]GGM54505.1 PadR family transcriptional regulator [Longimycelium tulufanense]